MRFSRQLSDWQIAAASMFCCGWGGNQFTPLLALYRTRDGFSEVVVDALLAAYVLGLAPALLVGGGLSDRHGRRRLMTVALISCLAGSLALSVDNLPGLALGRLLSGVGIGLAMAVGTTWAVELSLGAGLPAAAGARRASLALTAGLGLGAGVAGLLAQFGPLPASLPYWVHVAVTAPVLVLVLVAGTETVLATGTAAEPGPAAPTATAPFRPPLRWHAPEALADPRFRRLILPLAPWIFGAAGIAYATVPEALDGRVGHFSLLYATVLTVVAMTAGFLVQPLAHRLDHPRVPRSIGLALGVVTAGMAFAALTVQLQLAWLGGLITAVTLGSALGLAMVAGLLEIQRLAPPAELARTTGVFYALSYIGFLAPMLIAMAGHWVATAACLWLLTALAATCALLIASASATPRRHAVGASA
jgi:MFS family permease